MEASPNAVISRFISLLGETASNVLGPKTTTSLVPEITIRRGVSRLWRGAVEQSLDLSNTAQLKQKITILIDGLERVVGAALAESWLEDIYTKLEKAYSPALTNEYVLPLVPEHHLEKYRLRLFSKEELASMLEHERERDRELAKANAELKEVDRRKSEFISVVAHQLRTPLAGLKWALDLLVKGQAGPVSSGQKDILQKSYEGNERMIGLVEEMLRADRIEAGKFAPTLAPTDLEAVLKSVVDEFSSQAKERGVVLVMTRPAQPIPTLSLDPEQIRSVFQNLVENAVQYSKSGGAVTIALTKEPSVVTVSIADQGVGIPKSQQSEIFSRFFRAKNARLLHPDGNGLGLYIVKNIVLLHKGTVRFESEENKGTTFFVTLPL